MSERKKEKVVEGESKGKYRPNVGNPVVKVVIPRSWYKH